MTDRKQERIDSKMDARRFDDPDVKTALDEMSERQLVAMFGALERVVHYAQPFGNWKVGDGRPALADDDPAVIQAIGRCAAHRVQGGYTLPDGTHPKACAWCPYPKAQLLAACDWATYMSRYVVAEVLVWRKGAEGSERHITYERGGRSGVYESPRWADLWGLPPEQRATRIHAAQYEEATP